MRKEEVRFDGCIVYGTGATLAAVRVISGQQVAVDHESIPDASRVLWDKERDGNTIPLTMGQLREIRDLAYNGHLSPVAIMGKIAREASALTAKSNAFEGLTVKSDALPEHSAELPGVVVSGGALLPHDGGPASVVNFSIINVGPPAATAAPAQPASEQSALEGARGRPTWVPKKARTLARWQEAYLVIAEMQKESRDPDDWGDDPMPKLGEYRDRLKDEIGWSPCEKIVGRIIRAGGEGWLT